MRTPRASFLRLALLLGLVLAAAACGGGQATGGGSAGPGASSGTAAPGGQPAIVLDRPRDGATVHAPIRFAGSATVFEGTVDVELRAPDGRELASTFVTASCGNGCRGHYSGSISPPASYRGPVRLRLFERSAEDGSELHAVEVGLTVAG